MPQREQGTAGGACPSFVCDGVIKSSSVSSCRPQAHSRLLLSCNVFSAPAAVVALLAAWIAAAAYHKRWLRRAAVRFPHSLEAEIQRPAYFVQCGVELRPMGCVGREQYDVASLHQRVARSLPRPWD